MLGNIWNPRKHKQLSDVWARTKREMMRWDELSRHSNSKKVIFQSFFLAAAGLSSHVTFVRNFWHAGEEKQQQTSLGGVAVDEFQLIMRSTASFVSLSCDNEMFSESTIRKLVSSLLSARLSAFTSLFDSRKRKNHKLYEVEQTSASFSRLKVRWKIERENSEKKRGGRKVFLCCSWELFSSFGGEKCVWRLLGAQKYMKSDWRQRRAHKSMRLWRGRRWKQFDLFQMRFSHWVEVFPSARICRVRCVYVCIRFQLRKEMRKFTRLLPRLHSKMRNFNRIEMKINSHFLPDADAERN